MTPTVELVDALLCQRCGGSRVADLCIYHPTNPAQSASACRDRHLLAVRRATYGATVEPLPDPPPRTRWVAEPRWVAAHLVGCGGRSLCGKATTGLGSRPAHAGARWCRLCWHAAEVDG